MKSEQFPKNESKKPVRLTRGAKTLGAGLLLAGVAVVGAKTLPDSDGVADQFNKKNTLAVCTNPQDVVVPKDSNLTQLIRDNVEMSDPSLLSAENLAKEASAFSAEGTRNHLMPETVAIPFNVPAGVGHVVAGETIQLPEECHRPE